MDKNLKKILNKKRKMKIGYLFACLLGAKHKWNWLRKKKVFKYIGKNVLFQPNVLPNDPEFIKIHDNVQIANGVKFYNHDVINSVFNNMMLNNGKVLDTHIDCIEIMENCFIGGNSTIVGGVKIGPNAIVAAGSVVVSDVPAGKIVGGNPAKIIGNFEELKNRREKEDTIFEDYESMYKSSLNMEEKNDKLWYRFDKKHEN